MESWVHEEAELRIDARRLLLEAASSGEHAAWTWVYDTYSQRDRYYITMSANVRAEFLDSLEESRKQPLLRLFGQGVLQSESFEVSLSSETAHEVVQAGKPVSEWVAEQEAALGALKDNVVLVDSTFFWITKSEVLGVDPIRNPHQRIQAALKGFAVRDSTKIALESQGPARLQVLMFAGDFASRLRASEELRQAQVAACPELETAVLDPRKDVRGTYRTSTRKALGARLHTDVMPINEDQLNSIHGLRNRLEVIHGPPGTGKSTTIFHTLSAYLPTGSSAIVTCVCNQAVDAVAEKLQGVQDLQSKGCLPMLVLGNPLRLGPTAADHVLKVQAEREELVLFMRKICKVLGTWVRGLQGLQRAREEKLLAGGREIKQSRLSQRQISCIPGLLERVLRRLLETHDPEYLLLSRGLRSVAELEQRWTRVYSRLSPSERTRNDLNVKMREAHLDVVNRVRRAMAEVAAQSLPINAAGYSVHNSTDSEGALWHLGKHLSTEKERLRTAERWLGFAIERAPRRVVRRSRVFLCTIPSSYRVEQLKEDYSADFPGSLFMAMCDEAAATAETYVPLMLKLAVGNLVLLGDHKQLQPLVLAKNYTEPEEKRVSRSLMERVLDAGRSAAMLRTQYRMFAGLCSIVSDLFYKGKLVTAEEKLHQDTQQEGESADAKAQGGKGGKGGMGRGACVEICWSDGIWYPAVVKRPCPMGGFYVDCQGETLYIPSEWVRRPARTAVIFKDPKERLRWFDSVTGAPEVAVGTSFANSVEVAQIRELLRTDPVLSKTSERIKVVTLYKTQLQLMQRTCSDIVQSHPNVEFVTVDACQGTEAPHIVLSTVRTCRGRIGFASNPRRLNVAISRAIKSLTIVGSMNALSGDWNWAAVAAGCRRLGRTQQVDIKALRASDRARLANIEQEVNAMAASKESRQQSNRMGGMDSPHTKGFGGFGSRAFGGKASGGKASGGKASGRFGSKGSGSYYADLGSAGGGKSHAKGKGKGMSTGKGGAAGKAAGKGAGWQGKGKGMKGHGKGPKGDSGKGMPGGKSAGPTSGKGPKGGGKGGSKGSKGRGKGSWY